MCACTKPEKAHESSFHSSQTDSLLKFAFYVENHTQSKLLIKDIVYCNIMRTHESIKAAYKARIMETDCRVDCVGPGLSVPDDHGQFTVCSKERAKRQLQC